jgi:uncharacterized membrane protein
MVDLGTLGGHNSTAVAINDQCRIVGYSNTVNDDTYSHATMWNVASCATVAAHIDSRSPVAAGVR